MLTSRHLAILRAALRYFDEEMSPNGQHLMQFYFDEPIGEELTSVEFQELRNLLKNCRIRYLCYDQTTDHVTRPELFTTVEATRSAATSVECRVATVLLAPLT